VNPSSRSGFSGIRLQRRQRVTFRVALFAGGESPRTDGVSAVRAMRQPPGGLSESRAWPSRHPRLPRRPASSPPKGEAQDFTLEGRPLKGWPPPPSLAAPDLPAVPGSCLPTGGARRDASPSAVKRTVDRNLAGMFGEMPRPGDIPPTSPGRAGSHVLQGGEGQRVLPGSAPRTALITDMSPDDGYRGAAAGNGGIPRRPWPCRTVPAWNHRASRQGSSDGGPLGSARRTWDGREGGHPVGRRT
jgi:hypothetical protein